jgi:hypothetical protein
VAISDIESVDVVVASALAQPLRLRFFLGIFATLAILLSAVGVYGTVRYAVACRRAEFGIQLAPGASPSRVFGDVVRGALAPVALGATCGDGARTGAAHRHLRDALQPHRDAVCVDGARRLDPRQVVTPCEST